MSTTVSTEGESGEQGKRVLMGVDAGTESIRVGLFDMTGNLVHSDSMPYQTTFPHNGWAEQSPEDWWALLGECSRKVLRDSGVHPLQVKGISIDTTCCSVVALDSEGQPLRPCLLWMDSRSANQCRSILSAAKGDSSLQVNSGGQGPLSAEWMIPKALWIKENEPDIWARATYVCEKQDYINFNLTGCMVASACNVAARWHFNAQKAVNCSLSASGESIDWASNDHGRPVSLLSKVGLLDVLDRWPTQVVALGSAIGQGLTKTAADHLGLSEGIVVAQGGPDAFVGMVGLGCIHPGDVALITGSSHLHLCVCDNPSPDMKGVGHAGCWGVYRAAPVTNIAFAEGGQSSTGSVMSWLKNSIMSTSRADGAYGPSRHGTEYRDLDAEAAQLPIGAEGLVALETFQGARTPLTNACQRGAIVGLSLAHTRGHVWRAFLEAVCYGTKACLDALEEATNTEGVDQDLNYSHSAVAIAGGVTRSPMWLQMHADVMQRPVVVGECENAPLLGCAILAAAALKYQSEGKVDEDSQMRELSPMNLSLANHIEACVRQMVRQGKYVLPSAENANAYNRTYEVYCKLAPALEEIFHSMS